jgi:hypothetical protein
MGANINLNKHMSEHMRAAYIISSMPSSVPLFLIYIGAVDIAKVQ